MNSQSDSLLTAVEQCARKLNRAVGDGNTDHKVRDEVDQMMNQLAERVKSSKLECERARAEAKQAHESVRSVEGQANFDAQQVRKEIIKRTQEFNASAEAQIIHEAQRELALAVEGAGKHDVEAAEKAARNVGELVKEAESRNVEAQTCLEQATIRAQPPDVVVMPGSPTAEKWVITDRECGKLRVKHEASQLLMTVPSGQPLNILTILGAARRGKSFLMNALTGHDNLFPVSPNVEPCTAGADISPFLASLSDFERGGRSETSHTSPALDEPTIAFVDMEGQGDKSNEHGVRLATTFLVASKVVIYNWMFLPNKNTMLQELLVMVKAAGKVVNSEGKREHAFGHLIILLRDVTDRAAETEAFVMGIEDTEDVTFEAAKDGIERNLIRTTLKKAFKSITFHTMPSPHANIGLGAVPLSAVTPEFSASLGQLRRIIAGYLASPHTFADQKIFGGQRINDIVRGLCKSINDTGKICPPSVFEAIDMERADQEVQRALVKFDNMLGSSFGGHVVLTTVETNTALDQAREHVLQQFSVATEGISTGIVADARKELEKRVSPKAEVVFRNQELKRHELKNRMEAIACEHKANVADEARAFNLPMDQTALEGEWNQLVGSNFRELVQAIKTLVTEKTPTGDDLFREALLNQLGWAISREDFDDLVKDTHRNLQEKNRAAAAGEEDREARAKAEQKSQQLAEQADTFKEQLQVALDEAKEAKAAAAEAQASAARESQSQSSALMMMLAMMGGGGGFGGGGMGGMGGGAPAMGGMGGGSPYTAGGGSTLTFYPGGQYVPGGGRSPAGGGYFYR
ncbi:unnamed protein product [Ectocarpus fasciculatus]